MHFVFILSKAGAKTWQLFSRNIKDNSYTRTEDSMCVG